MLEYLETETSVKTVLEFKRRAMIIDQFRAQLEGVQSDIKQTYYENLLENNFFASSLMTKPQPRIGPLLLMSWL